MLGGLKQKAEDARGLQTLIGHTQRLQREYREAFLSGGREADGIRRKIDQHNTALKAAGLDVGNLDRAYAKLGRTVKGIEWQTAGKEKIQSGVELGRTAAVGLVGATMLPTKTSADYQAEIRDIAIKGNFAGTAQEKQLDKAIRESAAKNGMGQQELAGAINQLVAGGMDAKEAIKYADVIGKFSVGQNTTSEDTAKMIRAISSNAKIKDEKGMEKALESIAYLGNAGNFESPDMAKAFPGLLAQMANLKIYGQDAVTQLGAMLQVQMKVTGSADEAANNLNNWFSKISAPDTIKNYEKAGIDYAGSMEDAIKGGHSPLEASMALAKKYIETVDPKKAAEIKKAAAALNNIDDPEKRKQQIAAFAESIKMGSVFGDMQAKAALTAYMQNEEAYRKLKEAAANSKGVLDKGLADRRETSSQKWREAGDAFDAAMVSLGDAIRPVTDAAADLAAGALKLGSALTQNNPGLALGAVAGGLALLVVAAKRVVGGATQWAAGKVLEKAGFRLPGGKGGAKGGIADMLGNALGGATPGSGVQQVFVTNWPAGGAGALGGDMPGGPDGAGKTGAKSGAAKAGRLARVGGALKSAGRFLGRNAGGVLAVGAAAYQVYDTAKNAKTAEEKGHGYGGAAGTLAGGLAGAKLGAVIGTMIAPGIGTAIGGVLGGAIGAFGGDKIGGWLGKTVATAGGEKKPSQLPTVASVQSPADKPAQAVTPAVPVVGKTPAPVVPVTAQASAGGEKKAPFAPPSAVPASAGKPPQAVTPAVPVVVKASAPAVPAVTQATAGVEKKSLPVPPSVVMAPALTGKPVPAVSPAVPVVVKVPVPAVAAAAPLASGGEKKPVPPPAPVPQPVPKPSSPPATPAPAATGKAQTVKKQTFTFNPTIQVTVKGDVKDPRQIAAEIAPHLKRIFDGWQQQASRSAMFDPVG